MRSALYYSVLPAAFSFSRRPPGEDATLQLSYFSYNNKNEKRKFHFLLFLFLLNLNPVLGNFPIRNYCMCTNTKNTLTYQE